MPRRLNPKCKLGAEFHKVATAEIGAAIRKLKAGNVHQTRSGIKRLRALLALLHFAAGGRRCASTQEQRLRDAARSLSQSRDLEVCLATLDAMGKVPEFLDQPSAALLQQAREAVSGSRRETDEDFAVALRKLKGVQCALVDWAPKLDWKAVRRGLERSYRRVRRADEKACQTGAGVGSDGSGAMHVLRKRVKRLWAQLRLVHDCRPHVIGKLAGKVGRLGDLLGNEHDLVILRDRLCEAGDPERFSLLHRMIEQRRTRLDSESMALAAQMFSDPPEKFIRRIFKSR